MVFRMLIAVMNIAFSVFESDEKSFCASEFEKSSNDEIIVWIDLSQRCSSKKTRL